jgi:hypothetical protein
MTDLQICFIESEFPDSPKYVERTLLECIQLRVLPLRRPFSANGQVEDCRLQALLQSVPF